MAQDANPRSSWNAMSGWQLQNPHSANSREEDISVSATSFTNTSNHSGPSMDSSSADLSLEAIENHLWSQGLLSFGSDRDLQNSHVDGENFIDVLSSKTLASETFDPSSDYLMEPLNSYQESLIEHETLTNFSDLVSNLSIARSNSQVDQQIAPSTCNLSINPSLAQCSTSIISHIKQDLPTSPIFTATGMLGDQNMGYMPYMHEIKGESQIHEIGSSIPSLLKSFNNNDMGNQISLNNSIVGLGNKFNNGLTDVPWSNTTSLSDPIFFSGCLSNPAVELQASKSSMNGSDSSESKNQGHGTSAWRRGCGARRKGKKKRSEDNSDAPLKKSNHESSTESSLKLQATNDKVRERITELQQIVSPFGKTDRASVLSKAFTSIKYLQEQVKLLSEPYMKSSANKDHNSWGGLERKDKAEAELDLRSRGLCLVPIYCIPKIYHDNAGLDYWAPPFRGPMFR